MSTRYEDLPPVNGAVKPETYRQTFLAHVDRCPRSGYLYAVHDGGAPSAQLMRGRAFHEFAERATKACIEHGALEIPADDAKAILQEVLDEHLEWPVSAEEMETLRVCVHHFAECFCCPNPTTSPLVEEPFSLDVDGAQVTGTIDLAWVTDNTLHIRDYKSGRNLYRTDDVSGKDPLTGERKGLKAVQLLIYTLLAVDGQAGSGWSLPAGVEYVDVRFVFPYFVTEEGGMAERGAVLHLSELIEHRAWLRTLVARTNRGFASGVWPAVSGRHCASKCPSPQECPIPAYLRKSHGISPYERDAGELAEEVFFMASDLKERKALLKPFAQRYGPIPFGEDLELSHKRTEQGIRFDFRKRGEGI